MLFKIDPTFRKILEHAWGGAFGHFFVTGDRPTTQWYRGTSITDDLFQPEGSAAFYSPLPTAVPKPIPQRAQKTDYIRVAMLFVDMDHEFDVENLALRPNYIIHTSQDRGHLLYLIRDPFPIQNEADMLHAQTVWAGVSRVLGGDESSRDLGHLGRVPGSLNHKSSPPFLVSLEEIDAPLREWYELEALADQAPATQPKPPITEEIGPIREGGRHLAMKEYIAKAKRVGFRGAELFVIANAINEDMLEKPLPKIEVDRLVQWASENVESPATPNRPPSAIKLADLMKLERQEPQWLLPGLVPAEDLTLLGGDPGAAKTWLALDLALSLVTQKPSWGGITPPKIVPVLYCGEDAAQSSTLDRVYKLRSTKGFHNGEPFYVFPSTYTFQIDNPEGLALIETTIADTGAKLVIFDMLLSYLGKTDFNSGSEMAAVLTGLKAALRRQGCAALILHHGTKAKQGGWLSRAFGGAIQIGGHMESVLEAKEEKADESRFSITQRKSRLGRIRGRSTYQLRMGDDVAELVWDSNMLSKEVQAANVLLNEVAHTGQLGITEAAAVLKGAGLPGTHAFITGKVSVELRASPLVSIRGSGKLWVVERSGDAGDD